MGENLVVDRLAGDQLNVADAANHDVNALERLDINDRGCAHRKFDLKGKRRDVENADPSFRPI